MITKSFVERNVTVIVKSFLRFVSLSRLLDSIVSFYPGIHISVADDSGSFPQEFKDRFSKYNVEIHSMEYDSGLSAGRNHLIKNLTKDYFFLIDDDFVLTDPNVIEKLFGVMEKTDATIVSGGFEGAGQAFYGYYTVENKQLVIHRYAQPPNNALYETWEGIPYCRCRFVPNFFLAKTHDFHNREIYWDQELKVAEHIDFFLRFPSDIKNISCRNSIGCA